jgi:hypothetical protein
LFWDKYLALFLQDPTIPEVSKLIAKRMLLKCNGKTANEINVLIPYTNAERKALDYLTIVNLGKVPESIFKSPPEYLPTYWIYLQKAENGEAKEVVLSALQQALVEVPQQAPTAP